MQGRSYHPWNILQKLPQAPPAAGTKLHERRCLSPNAFCLPEMMAERHSTPLPGWGTERLKKGGGRKRRGIPVCCCHLTSFKDHPMGMSHVREHWVLPCPVPASSAPSQLKQGHCSDCHPQSHWWGGWGTAWVGAGCCGAAVGLVARVECPRCKQTAAARYIGPCSWGRQQH